MAHEKKKKEEKEQFPPRLFISYMPISSERRYEADLVPDGAEGGGRGVCREVGGVELAGRGQRRGVARRLPHPVPVRRRLLRRRLHRRRRRRRLLHLSR